jgi:hypothetical protein
MLKDDLYTFFLKNTQEVQELNEHYNWRRNFVTFLLITNFRRSRWLIIGFLRRVVVNVNDVSEIPSASNFIVGELCIYSILFLRGPRERV